VSGVATVETALGRATISCVNQSHVSEVIGFGATVANNGSPYATRPLSCLSVTLVYCGHTVVWTKMPLGTEVGLSPGDIVLDGNQHPPPFFGPCLLWPNGRPSQQLLSSCL